MSVRRASAWLALFVALAACSDDPATSISAGSGGTAPSSATSTGAPSGAGGSAEAAGQATSASSGSETGFADASSAASSGGSAPVFETVSITNPAIAGDHPDPGVLRTIGDDGRPLYVLTHTSGNGDPPIYTSRDLLHWERQPEGAFHYAGGGAASVNLPSSSFCHIWAPQIVETDSGMLLSFTAERHAGPQASCPGFSEEQGVYMASAASPLGPFATADHPWEPFPAGANADTCAIRDDLPASVDYATPDCLGGFCHHVIRLDSDVWRDPATGRWWMAYSWYTNSPPQVPWEVDNHGEHTHVVELDPADPWAVRCDAATPQIFVANAQDDATKAALAGYCPDCGEMLSNTKGRFDEEVVRDGASWGVAEGTSLFRRGDWVYALVSGSLWDSGYYHVYFVAAPTVEELAVGSPTRIVGRYLIPSEDQAFGHGSAVLGPDGETWYFVHHRLDHAKCRDAGDCSRDVWVSRIDFEDRGDGRGDAWIVPRRPARDPDVEVRVLAE